MSGPHHGTQGPSRRLKGLLDEGLHGYLNAHTPITEVQQELRERTYKEVARSGMLVPADEGHFLSWLVGSLRVNSALEVGTFTGYSALAIALALPADGQLTCLDIDERPIKIAREAWDKAGVGSKIQVKLAPAAETLQQLVADGKQGTFDFAFIDADKPSYLQYYELVLKLVRVGGVIAVDNVLWAGRITDEQDTSENTVALRKFNDTVFADTRVSASLTAIGDGLYLIRRLA